MLKTLTLAAPVTCKPLWQWGSVAVELLGTQTRFVQGRRWRHRVIQHGSGDALILLHGVGGHAETWARNMKTLGEHFTVYAVDALFHGYTDKPEWDRPTDRHDMQVDAIADLMDALELPWAHIEGESMGGQLACEFGLRYPDRSGKIIMNTGVGRIRFKKTDFVVPEADYAELARLSAAAITDPTFDVVKKRLEWLMHDKARMTDDMAEIRLRIYQDPAINDALHRFNSVGLGKSDPWDLDPQWDEEVLSTFKPEALVFWTEHNPGEASDLGEYVAERIPGCLFYLMADAAHWPQWEKPEEHDAVVIQFLMG